MAARSKACVCDRSLVGIALWNPAEGIDACLLSVVCCQRTLRQAYHSSRGYLPNVLCLSVIVKPR